MPLTRMKRRPPRERDMPLTRIKRRPPRERDMPLTRMKGRQPRERDMPLTRIKRRPLRERDMPLVQMKGTPLRERYASHSDEKKAAERERYASRSDEKKAAERERYASYSEQRKRAERKRYNKYRSVVLLKRRRAYYGSLLSRRAARILHRASRYMKEKVKCTLSCELKNTARYSLHEPKQETKELYVKVVKKRISAIVSLRYKLIVAFRSSHKALAEEVRASKLTNVVLNIAVRKLLNQVLKRRKQIVGEFLTCVHSGNVLTISGDDFRECWHTASSEPYFYDQSYTLVKHDFPIPIDSNGRCIIAEDIGDSHKKTDQGNGNALLSARL